MCTRQKGKSLYNDKLRYMESVVGLYSMHEYCTAIITVILMR